MENIESEINATVGILQRTIIDPSQQTSIVLNEVARVFERAASIANNANITITQQVLISTYAVYHSNNTKFKVC